MGCSVVGSACWAVCLVAAPGLFAQTAPTGTIRADTVWSGQITIAADVTITEATVRVASGSTIRFVADDPLAAVGPLLRLDSPSDVPGKQTRCAKLILAGTPDHPITVETPAGLPPGRITAPPASFCSVIARHVIFRRLGTSDSLLPSKPALQVRLSQPDSDLWIHDCGFEHCGPLRAEVFGPHASVEITRCTFTHPGADLVLALVGSGTGVKVVAENIADAAFRLECPQVLLRENILIGERAAIIVSNPAAHAITITHNYVHCTTRRDQGRCALRCETPDADVRENVLMGGTYVVETAPRALIGNVLIGVAGLDPTLNLPALDVKRLKNPTPTHYLVRDLAPGAVVTDNVFLGPAFAALATSDRADRPCIQYNVFDGWGVAGRAVHFNLLLGTPVRATSRPSSRPTRLMTGADVPAAKPLRATLTHNVITRYVAPPIYDERQLDGTLEAVGHNLFAQIPGPLYERIGSASGKAPGDGRFDRLEQLRLESPPATQAAADLESQLLERRLSVAEVRARWFAAYRPGPGSPLRLKTPIGPRCEPAPEP